MLYARLSVHVYKLKLTVQDIVVCLVWFVIPLVRFHDIHDIPGLYITGWRSESSLSGP